MIQVAMALYPMIRLGYQFRANRKSISGSSPSLIHRSIHSNCLGVGYAQARVHINRVVGCHCNYRHINRIVVARRAESARRGIQGNTHTGDSATNYQNIELFGLEAINVGLASEIHRVSLNPVTSGRAILRHFGSFSSFHELFVRTNC